MQHKVPNSFNKVHCGHFIRLACQILLGGLKIFEMSRHVKTLEFQSQDDWTFDLKPFNPDLRSDLCLN